MQITVDRIKKKTLIEKHFLIKIGLLLMPTKYTYIFLVLTNKKQKCLSHFLTIKINKLKTTFFKNNKNTSKIILLIYRVVRRQPGHRKSHVNFKVVKY